MLQGFGKVLKGLEYFDKVLNDFRKVFEGLGGCREGV